MEHMAAAKDLFLLQVGVLFFHVCSLWLVSIGAQMKQSRCVERVKSTSQ